MNEKQKKVVFFGCMVALFVFVLVAGIVIGRVTKSSDLEQWRVDYQRCKDALDDAEMRNCGLADEIENLRVANRELIAECARATNQIRAVGGAITECEVDTERIAKTSDEIFDRIEQLEKFLYEIREIYENQNAFYEAWY